MSWCGRELDEFVLVSVRGVEGSSYLIKRNSMNRQQKIYKQIHARLIRKHLSIRRSRWWFERPSASLEQWCSLINVFRPGRPPVLLSSEKAHQESSGNESVVSLVSFRCHRLLNVIREYALLTKALS